MLKSLPHPEEQGVSYVGNWPEETGYNLERGTWVAVGSFLPMDRPWGVEHSNFPSQIQCWPRKQISITTVRTSLGVRGVTPTPHRGDRS
jgi:hypothetical protein